MKILKGIAKTENNVGEIKVTIIKARLNKMDNMTRIVIRKGLHTGTSLSIMIILIILTDDVVRTVLELIKAMGTMIIAETFMTREIAMVITITTYPRTITEMAT